MKNTLLLFSLSFLFSTSNAQTNYLDNYLSGNVTYSTIGGTSQQVSLPRDLDFKPGTNELWVVNKGTSTGSGTVTFHNAGLPNQSSYYRKDSHVSHFMTYCTAIAFGDDGTFGCISESTNGGNEFMGPSLISADTAIYAKVFQNNWVNGYNLGSHLDMLHQSSYGMGMAYDNGHAFWVFDGFSGNICKYDFHATHGPGNDDHSDGEIWRYTDVTVTRVPNVPSHMVLDKANNWLYFIDGGTKTLKRMNIGTGAKTGNLSATSEPLAGYHKMTGATVQTLETFTSQPCGIDYYNNRLIVGDYTNGDITIYNTSSGTPVKLGKVATGQAGMTGIKIGPDGNIWFVNYTANTVVRMSPATQSPDDAGILNITSPTVTDYEANFYGLKVDVCATSITPAVTLINNGSNTLTSVTINFKVDNGTPSTFSWTGSLASNASTSVTLPSVSSLTGGGHKLTVYTSSPNGNPDPNPANDKKGGSFRVEQLASFPFTEGFTSSTFPPAGWDYIDIGNPESNMSRIANIGGFGNNTGCVKLEVFNSPADNSGQIDYLMTPQIDLTSAPATGTTFDFSVAYRQYNTSTSETLKVLASVDCGNTWAAIYNKSGSSLATTTVSTAAFNTPTAAQWRKESIVLAAPYIGQNTIFLFATTTNYGNNIFLDDVNITNPALGITESNLSANVTIYPNPTSDFVTIEGENGMLTGANVTLCNVMGEAVLSAKCQTNYLSLDLSSFSNGIYFLSIKSDKGTTAKKIIVNK